MNKPKIAIVSFPGNNCEVESIRAIRNNGMEPVFFRWNDDVSKLKDIDGYFIPGGFSYEDRGRAGMVAARDPLLQHIKDEASKGKVVIGNCNGAQILVESGLIPNSEGLAMSLAKNVVNGNATGFINEWIWVTPHCDKSRCATSNWEGSMHIPLAHGEGRFTTKDAALWQKLVDNNQIAFVYCDEEGNTASTNTLNPNGSEMSAAGLCNPEGNVVALMPHPERTPLGDAYFASVKTWIDNHPARDESTVVKSNNTKIVNLQTREASGTEIFIETIIVNNEERTVEQAAKREKSGISIKQLRYIQLPSDTARDVLTTITHFNPNKETAYIRRGDSFMKWNADTKQEQHQESILDGIALLRRDEPDTDAQNIAEGAQSGICYVCSGVSLEDVSEESVLNIFGNPHASTINRLL